MNYYELKEQKYRKKFHRKVPHKYVQELSVQNRPF